MRIPFAVLAVAAALLAGCAGPASSSDDGTGAGPPPPTTMSIVGVVQDETFAGVGGAQVSLRLLNRSTLTDSSGAFRFDGLQVSAYLVDVNATGFEPATLTAEPSTDGNSSLTFVLLQQTSLRPRVTVEHFKGTYECAFEALIIPGSCDVLLEMAGQSPFEDLSTFQLGLGRSWQSVAVDVDFDLSANPGLEGLRLVVRGIRDADSGGEYEQFGRFWGADPFTAILDVNGTYPDGIGPVPGNLTALELVVYPQGHGWHQVCEPTEQFGCFLGAGAGTDVQFDLYVTVFYNQQAPDGYTLRTA